MKEITLRMTVSLVLFVTWLATGITGVLLLVAPLVYRMGASLPMSWVTNVHIYVGFVFFGLSFLHLALNWPAMKGYIKRIRRT